MRPTNETRSALESGRIAERSAAVRKRARDLGFQKVGIVSADALLEERARLEAWLQRGLHAEMSYLARNPEQRTDPRKIFPGARSVVVVALNYYTPHQHEVALRQYDRGDEIKTARRTGEVSTIADRARVNAQSNQSGKISRYAWGDDYHEVMANKLREVLDWIREQWVEAEGKVCVDIQPTMDKAWAVRAGLGWMGKHTNVIAQDYGSWIFIGELILNVELAYDDEEIADQCGSCTLCLDACPTGALVEPYVLNSNLCISHATIESRAPEIRADVASNLEGWLYGCDICQDVCPWNRMTPETSEPRFEPREGNINASLSEIIELTPETYAERFRHSAMKRAKLAGLQRNARALLLRPTEQT